MTDKERLEEVKGVVSTWKTILSEGKFPNITSEEVELVETLIIERMQELESKNKLLKSNLSVVQGYYKNMIKINKDIVEQNQQYREAIEKASNELAWGDAENASLRAYRFLYRALRGESQ